MIRITLPDGKLIEAQDGSTTFDIAERIGPRLRKATVAGKVTVNGHSEIVDANRPLPGDCTLHIVTGTDESADALYVLRHSTAHVMAEAICKLFPDTKLAYGPPLEDGFYYDLDLDRSITPDDFEQIEAEMARIIKENRPFTRYEMSRDEAMSKLEQEKNRYKVDNAVRAEGDCISFYVTGDRAGEDFEDLCRGPHVPNTGVIGAFKVRVVAGSHYRGDVNDTPLQRVYGTAFFKKKALAEYLEQLEQAKARDHRVIGKELGLFTISPDVGSGLVLWQPKGSMVRMQLERFLLGEMLAGGYQPVNTPHIGRLDLYRTSGHYPYYEDSQFPALYETDRGKVLLTLKHIAQRAQLMVGDERDKQAKGVARLAGALQENWGTVDGLESDDLATVAEAADRELVREEGFLLKPMNCPHHIQIYKSMPRSYRDLPVRLCEFGTVYRYEQSGELSGLTRVRGFTQDDAHLFCTPDQLEDELASTIELTLLVLRTLEFHDYRVRIGLGDRDSDKYVGPTELWEQAEENLRRVARNMGLEFEEVVGEAAFYGPKIDFMVRDCIGREWQLGTVQADYNAPIRFDLSYIGADNHPHRPIMIHRAPFGSLERFVGILIEHFAGAFPLWLAPVQVAVTTISEKSLDYGEQVYRRCREAGLRCEADFSSEKIGPKKHKLRQQKIPYILVVGAQEAEEDTVNINDREGKNLGTYPLENFLERCSMEIQTKGRNQEALQPV